MVLRAVLRNATTIPQASGSVVNAVSLLAQQHQQTRDFAQWNTPNKNKGAYNTRLMRSKLMGNNNNFNSKDRYQNIDPEAANKASWPQARFGLRRNVPINVLPGNFNDYRKWDESEEDDKGGKVEDDPDFLDWDRTEHIDEERLVQEIMKKQEEKEKEQRAKWMETYRRPKEFKTKIDEKGRSYARGARKTASARVWIQPGLGEIVVNKKDYAEYFVRETLREHILEPFLITETVGLFDVYVTVRGGGLTGQAGAIQYGLANCLQKFNPELYRPPLRYKGLLTRDMRKVERKKIGKLKARKSRPWVKR